MPYPAPRHVAPDSPTIRTNTDFLDIHLYSAQPQQDRAMWQTDEAQLALFHQEAIPYVLVHFPRHRVTFDCPFNILRVSVDIRQAWFFSDKSMTGLILASYSTNLFFGMQRIGVDWADELRTVTRQSMQQYPTAEAIDQRGQQIEARLTTAQMWQQRWRKPV